MKLLGEILLMAFALFGVPALILFARVALVGVPS